MSVQSKFLTRLGLESLEAREVPAIVFVGCWGSSMDQYAHNDPASAAADYSAIAFVGGWGSSAAPSGPGSLGIEVHVVHTPDPLPVLLVIADRRDFNHSTNGGLGDSRSPALRKGGWVMDVTLPPSADGSVTDDVVVDGRIITGENWNTAVRGGAKYKMLMAPLILELDAATPATPTGKLRIGSDAGDVVRGTADHFENAGAGTSGGGLQTRQTTVTIDM